MAQLKPDFSRAKMISSAVIGSILLIGVFFIGAFFTVIDAGEVGVVSTFGKVSDKPMESGFHLKNPFSQIINMNTRTHSYTMSGTQFEGEVQGDDSIHALASDGGAVWIDATVLYRLKSEAAPEIYKNLGITYEDSIVRPEIRSIIRGTASKYPVSELYSEKRDEFQQVIFDSFSEALEERGIVVEEVLVRKVNVSESLTTSIAEKLAAEQEVQRLEFEIQKAGKEAERQRVEAEGQKAAQAIINSSLSDKYIQYLYVTNLKDMEGTVYIPTEGGVPLFKGV